MIRIIHREVTENGITENMSSFHSFTDICMYMLSIQKLYFHPDFNQGKEAQPGHEALPLKNA